MRGTKLHRRARMRVATIADRDLEELAATILALTDSRDVISLSRNVDFISRRGLFRACPIDRIALRLGSRKRPHFDVPLQQRQS